MTWSPSIWGLIPHIRGNPTLWKAHIQNIAKLTKIQLDYGADQSNLISKWLQFIKDVVAVVGGTENISSITGLEKAKWIIRLSTTNVLIECYVLSNWQWVLVLQLLGGEILFILGSYNNTHRFQTNVNYDILSVKWFESTGFF